MDGFVVKRGGNTVKQVESVRVEGYFKIDTEPPSEVLVNGQSIQQE